MKVNLKKELLEELKTIPIIELACTKIGISRQTYYRWIKSSKDFSVKVEEAKKLGVSYVNDMTETELVNLIQNKNFQAVAFWLKHRHPEYRSKVEITTVEKDKELTSEQKEIINQTIKKLTNYEN